MKFIVLFEDAADAALDLRKRHMRAHLEFLERHADKVEAAGPLADTEGRGRNGLWIVEACEQADVERLVREDPFWPTGLRASVSILRWTQVFADGRQQIAP